VQAAVELFKLLIWRVAKAHAIQFAWSFAYEREQLTPQFRLDRVRDEQDAHEADLWVETTRFEGVSIRFFAAK
jgi:hypothetical protein